MANYENKLADWHKHVEKLKLKKMGHSADDTITGDEVESISIESSAATANATEVASVDSVSAVVSEPIEMPKSRRAFVESDDTGDLFNSVIQENEAVSEPVSYTPSRNGGIFDDTEIPEVDDFLSFLEDKKEVNEVNNEMPSTLSEPPVSNLPQRPILSKMSEGTGEPMPINELINEITEEVVEETPMAVVETTIEKVLEEKTVVPEDKNEAQDNWEKIPHHLQTLFSSSNDEIAQNSYQTFKETRGELIQRLLDPVISLEEAARILNVCPTTVRRYTNRGVLQHIRTAGNQRRFRLSDVLAFMENGSKKG